MGSTWITISPITPEPSFAVARTVTVPTPVPVSKPEAFIVAVPVPAITDQVAGDPRRLRLVGQYTLFPAILDSDIPIIAAVGAYGALRVAAGDAYIDWAQFLLALLFAAIAGWVCVAGLERGASPI